HADRGRDGHRAVPPRAAAGDRPVDEGARPRGRGHLQVRAAARRAAAAVAQVLRAGDRDAAGPRARGPGGPRARGGPVDEPRAASAADPAAGLHLLPQRHDLFRSRRAAARHHGARAAPGAGRVPVRVALGKPERHRAPAPMGRPVDISPGAEMSVPAASRTPSWNAPDATRRVVVGIGEMAIASGADDVLVTYGLGSCVAVCLFDPSARVAAMLHFLLPEARINAKRATEQPAAFADTGIPLLLEAAAQHGLKKNRVRVRLVGGAEVANTPGGP